MSELTESLGQQAKFSVNILSIISSLIPFYIVWIILQSMVLHSLRNFPGPRIAAVTRIPYWVASLSGNQVRWMQSLHIKYGPIVRYGPNDLSYTETQAWKDIYGYQKGRKENPKDPKFYLISEHGAPALPELSEAEHAVIRRIIAPAFSQRALKKQEPLFQRFADMMVATIRDATRDRHETGVDMVKMFNLTTFDIMAELTFGEPLGLLEASEYTPWVELVFKSFSFFPVVQIVEYYYFLKPLFRCLEPSSVKSIRISHQKYSTERLDERLARGSDKPDFWSLILAENQAQNVLPVPQMHSNAQLFMAAGTETTATLLSGLTYLLLVNPRSMEILTDEIRGAFKSDEHINFESLAHLPYLNACIEEGLRIYPPVPSVMPRVIPEGGNEILGQWIPAGTSVTLHATTSYRDPNNFKDPGLFVPERWMGDMEYKNDKRDVRQPFSVGSRNCLGINMAWHEMRLLLAKVLFNLDFELCDESRDWIDQKVYLLWQKKPLMCRAIPVIRR